MRLFNHSGRGLSSGCGLCGAEGEAEDVGGDEDFSQAEKPSRSVHMIKSDFMNETPDLVAQFDDALSLLQSLLRQLQRLTYLLDDRG